MLTPAFMAFWMTWDRGNPAATSPATSARAFAATAMTKKHMIPQSNAFIIPPCFLLRLHALASSLIDMTTIHPDFLMQ
jgi:hypothetical protein